jgi:hypothetical protein
MFSGNGSGARGDGQRQSLALGFLRIIPSENSPRGYSYD